MTTDKQPAAGEAAWPAGGVVGRRLIAAVVVLAGALLVVPVAEGRAARPDLVVSAVRTSGAAAPGGTLAARVTVRNRGRAAARSSMVTLGLQGARSPLARAAVRALAKGRSLTLKTRLRLPALLAEGPVRIRACADSSKRVRERKERNNCRTVTLAGSGGGLLAPPPLTEPPPPPPTPTPTPAPTPDPTPPPGPGPSASPAPAPAPAPSPSPDPTPTPAPDPTPSPSPSPVPPDEVPHEELPPLVPSMADKADGLAGRQGAAEGVLSDTRAGLLRGRALTATGAPLAGVRVSVHDHPDVGSTLTGDDGAFTLAVNGGAQLTLVYSKQGFLEIQRDLDPAQLDWTAAPDVRLIPRDPAGVVLDPPQATTWKVARAGTKTDADGSRASTLLFAPGTTATMRFADGASRPLPGPWTVRQTEYTAFGPPAMPAELPPTSAYTYAAELSIDEADEAGADTVELANGDAGVHPAVNYVENFIGAPVGSGVPTGAYDRADAAWRPSPNGRVIEIVSESGGKANVDTDGDGDSDGDDLAPSLRLTDGERAALAPLYAPGDQLLRVPIPHMTPWDHNWPGGLPPGAVAPKLGPDGRPLPEMCQQRSSSSIDCEGQRLREGVRVAGTPYELSYSSAWGAPTQRDIEVEVTPDPLPNGLLGVELDVDVAGRHYGHRYADPSALPAGDPLPALTPGMVERIRWDGLDAFGDPVVGSVIAKVTLTYFYEPFYWSADPEERAFAQAADNAAAFAARRACAPGSPFSVRGDVCPFGLTTTETRILKPLDRSSVGLGGWDLDAHHLYDPRAREVLLGDGRSRRDGEVDLGRLRTMAGPGAPGSDGAAIPWPYRALAVLPDESIVWGDETGQTLWQWVPGEGRRRFAGAAGGAHDQWSECDGGPASERYLRGIGDIEARPDGSVVVTLMGAAHGSEDSRVCEITPDGRLVRLAGRGTCPKETCDPDVALEAEVTQPFSLALGPDGSVYFFDSGPGSLARIRKIDPAGGISTVVGGGSTDGTGDPDGERALGFGLSSIMVNSMTFSGTRLLFTDTWRGMILSLETDGTVHRFAGRFMETANYRLDADRREAVIGRPYAIAAAADGSVHAAVLSSTPFTEQRVRLIRIRPDGLVVRSAGWGSQQPCAPRLDVLESAINRCGTAPSPVLAVDGGGRPHVADGEFTTQSPGAIRRVESGRTTQAMGDDAIIPSADGSEVWWFDESGRHLRTVDPLTGATRLEFGYDAAGRLVRIEDADGHRTLIERDGDGRPTAIRAPDGRRTLLALDGDGRLRSITDPLGATRRLSYDELGLLDGQELPSGRHSSYDYDADGRLVRATGAAGQTRTLTRTTPAEDTVRVDVTTGEGRTTRYTDQRIDGGGVRRTVTSPSGATTELLVESDGTRRVTLPSGEVLRTEVVADPRFGATLLRPRRQTLTTPSGKASTVTYAYGSTTSGGIFNPISESRTMAGPLGTFSSTYDGSARTLETRSPGGRTTRTVLDARGRPVRTEVGDQYASDALAPVLIEYDASGQVHKLRQSRQETTYEHDAAGRLSAIVAADGQRLEYGYDAADRLTQLLYPGDRRYGYAYDPDGVLVSRTSPSGKTHTYAPTGFEGDVSRWTPPGGTESYTATRDGDGLATSVMYPTGVTRTVLGDGAGRLTGVSLPGASRNFAYAAGTDRIARWESTAAPGAEIQSLTVEADGMRVTKLKAGGLAAAETTWSYDAQTLLPDGFRLVSGDDDATLALAHDADGVPTGLGPFTYERQGPDRSLSAITDGTGRTEETVDAVADLKTRVLTVDGNERYRLELETDAAGRIVERRETAAGVQRSETYAYTTHGELAEVRRNGALVERYRYGADGDRVERTLGTGAPELAAYDGRGLLTARGATAYTFDADGFLATRGSDTFVYDRSGDLRSATAGGGTVHYAYDALGRRIGRIAAGQTTRYVYADRDDPFRVSAARAPDGTLHRYLYGPRGNLYAILRGTERFHVATDQLGSPRVVVAADGAVVKRLEYDSYGAETDEDPGFFLAIGFAGGLRDATTGLVRFGLRDYEPASGRFTSRDPAGFAGSRRNLYVYANNSPVTFRDPSGTVSVSFSAYAGLGGGFTMHFDPKAIFDRSKPFLTGMCFEGGAGLGGGFEADALEAAPDRLQLTAFGEIGAKMPGAGAKVGLEFDLICGSGKGKLGGNLGPLQGGFDTEGTPSAGGAASTSGWLGTLLGAANVKVEGKAGMKLCLPPPPR